MSLLKTQGIRWLESLLPLLEGKRASAEDLRAAKRFLCLEYETALGTAVTSTALYEALRVAVPDAFITVACSGIPGQVLKYNPNLDEVLLTPHPAKEWWKATAWFLTTLRKRRGQFDCVILDSGNRRFRYASLALLSGVPHRLGFEFPGDFNHASLRYDAAESILANNLNLLGLLGHRWEATEPSIYFSDSELRLVEDFLSEQKISEDKPIVAIQTQTSGGEPNQWFDDRFARVAEQLWRNWAAQVIFVGTESEAKAIHNIRQETRAPSCSAAGRTDIPSLAALLCLCDLLVTLDTGTMHVGRAVGVPMVVIAPAKNPAHEWLPLHDERYRIVRRPEGPCPKCGKHNCTSSDCMDLIQTGQVVEAVGQHLIQFPPSPEARDRRAFGRLRKSFSP